LNIQDKYNPDLYQISASDENPLLRIQGDEECKTSVNDIDEIEIQNTNNKYKLLSKIRKH